ncbi:MAG: glycosyltransferase family 4 protein, partial [Pseudomonadota bacterium]
MSPTSGQSLLITAIDFPPQIGGVATFSWEVAHSFHQLGFDVTVVTRQRDQQKINAPFKILEYSLPESGLLSVPLMRSHLKNLIEKNNFDAFFSTLWLPGGLALNLCLPQKSSHFICVHGMEIVESSQSWKKRLRKLLISIAKQQCFADATAIFCVSRFSRDLLLETLD